MKEFKVLKDHGSTMQSRAHFVRMFVGCEPGAQVHSYAHHLVILALVSPLPVAKSIHYHCGSTYNSALPVVRLVACWNAQVV